MQCTQSVTGAPILFLRELADSVNQHAAFLNRTVHLIAESDANNPRLLRSKEKGGYGLHAQWSDDFHHAVHAYLTGERNGYYVDFGALGDIAKVLKDNYTYDNRYSQFRKRPQGASAADLPTDQFVVCVQNHDQIGNRARGDRLSTLLDFEQQKLAAALLFFGPFVPLLFMGEEFGEDNPFLYFVDHTDPLLIEAVREGRKREFRDFSWGETLPDPASEDTFRQSMPQWEKRYASPHCHLLSLYQDLIVIKNENQRSALGALPEGRLF